MFYRIDEYGNIIDKGNFKYSDDCLETTENIVNHFNGKLIFEKESLTDTYLESLNEYNNKLSTDKIVSELTN